MRTYFDGKSHYGIFGIETAYGSGEVSATNRISKLQNISYTFNNNLILSQGVGEGADATSVNYGNFDVSGNLSTEPTEFSILQFCSGTIDGVGTSADPYRIICGDKIGYSGTFIRTGVVEIGAKGISNHQTYTLTGFSLNNWTLSGEQGGILKLASGFTSGSVTRGTSLTSVSSDDLRTFAFVSGSFGWDNKYLDCTNFNIKETFTSAYPKEVFTRFGKQPNKETRRYTWTITVNKHYDDSVDRISSTELLSDFFGGINTPATSGTVPSGKDMSVHIREGTTTGLREAVIQLQDSHITDWAENPSIEGGTVSITVNGISLSAKEESGNKTPIKWWTN